MELKNITIGSDPEFFATDGKELIPSYKFLPGTKDEPFDLGNGYFVQRDNVLVEGNIPPAKTAQEFEDNMVSLKDQIFVNFLRPMGLALVSADSGEYNREYLKHKEAITLGCSPYEMVWDDVPEQNVRDLVNSTKRPAGFHIHVGYDFVNEEDNNFRQMTNIVIAKLFDYFVINPSYDIHLDEFRNKYYGGIGKIRHKSYGVELRSLGGYFTQTKYFQPLFNQIENIIEMIKDDDLYFGLFNTISFGEMNEIKELSLVKETHKKLLINI